MATILATQTATTTKMTVQLMMTARVLTKKNLVETNRKASAAMGVLTMVAIDECSLWVLGMPRDTIPIFAE